jgi:hypothetical protein
LSVSAEEVEAFLDEPRPRMRDSDALDELRTPDGRTFRVTPIDQPAGVAMPDEFEPGRLVRRTLQIVALLAVVGLVLLLAPGLGEVRDLLTEARPEWVALAVAFEAMSCVSSACSGRSCRPPLHAPEGEQALVGDLDVPQTAGLGDVAKPCLRFGDAVDVARGLLGVLAAAP